MSVFRWPLKFLVLSCFFGEASVEAVSVDEIVSGVKVEAKGASPGAAAAEHRGAVGDGLGAAGSAEEVASEEGVEPYRAACMAAARIE